MRPSEAPSLRLPEELAQALGIAVTTVHQFCREGRIASVRVGKLIRIPGEEFERVIREGVPRKAEIQA